MAGSRAHDESDIPQLIALRRELAEALKKCTRRQREWILKLPEHAFRRWKAANAIGFSPACVSNALKRPHVLKAIACQERIAELQIGNRGRMVIQGLVNIVNADPRDFYEVTRTPDGSTRIRAKAPDEWTSEMADAVEDFAPDANGVWKPKLAPKRAAFDLLAKIGGMTLDRMELTGRDGGPLEIKRTVDDLTDEELAALAARGSARAAAKTAAGEKLTDAELAEFARNADGGAGGPASPEPDSGEGVH